MAAGADPAFERACLEAHNKYRAEHGSPPLTINKMLTTRAIKWAQDLLRRNKMEHSTGHTFGENIYMSQGLKVTGDMPVKAWYDEIKDYSFQEAKFSMSTGHFTQVLWKNTKEVGVGIARKGDLVYVVANYNPPGNVVGQFRENVLPKISKPAGAADSKPKPATTPAATSKPGSAPAGSKTPPASNTTPATTPGTAAKRSSAPAGFPASTPGTTAKPSTTPTGSKPTPMPQTTPAATAKPITTPSASKPAPSTAPGKTPTKPSTVPSGGASTPKPTTTTYRGSVPTAGGPVPTITVTSISPDMIKPPPAIKNIEIPAEQRKFHNECLEAHNKYRALHGVPALKLAEALTQYATNWAQQLVQLKTVKGSPSNSYGENIFMSAGIPVDGGTPVKLWYDQMKAYKFEAATFVPKAGGFTQVIWKESQELGVGLAQKDEETYVVVSYNPRGNVMGKFKENVLPKH